MARVAIVTGGVTGIGAATCRALEDAGRTVVATWFGNSKDAERFHAKTGIAVYEWNVSDFAACQHGVDEVVKKHGPVDILVNNAGITRDAMLHKMSNEQWRSVIDVDLGGCFNMCHAVVGAMRGRGFGRIVNVSSVNALSGQAGQTNYSAAKAGIIGFTKALALEGAARGITVNAIAPGYTDTGMVAAVPSEILNRIVSAVPMGRLARPDEIARGIAFLTSDEAGFVTGTTLSINDGKIGAAGNAPGKTGKGKKMDQKEIVLCAPVRTAIGTYDGTLKDIAAASLGAVVVREALRRATLDPSKVGTVVMGQVIQAGAKMNPARQAAIHGGLPAQAPAMTVNRVCGSGAQAIVSVAQDIMLGLAEAGIAGGMENMDQAPYLMTRGRWGYRMGNAEIYDSMLRDGLDDAFANKHSGWVTEDLAQKFQITRESQDRWALRSQQRFAAAQAAGKFEAEIAPVEVPSGKGTKIFAKDEHNRPDTTLESLARLKPAFRKDGTITAGNAPGLNSGAAAIVLAERQWAENHGLEPAARLVSFGIGAVEPGMFGLGPVPAVRNALSRAGWRKEDVERLEVNEAFAAIAIALVRELGISEEIVNVEGGAIAHGHPIGATGAVLTVRLLHSMQRDRLSRGVVTMCIGGGQGIALALESMH